MTRCGCKSSQITPTYRFSRSYSSLISVRSVDGSPWRGSRCASSPIEVAVDQAGSSRTPSTTIGVSILVAMAIRGWGGGGAIDATDAAAALKTTAAISVTCPRDLDSLGPECNHRIDSRRAPGREPRRTLGDEQQKDRQREVDHRVGRVDLEERLLQESRHHERADDPGDDADQRQPPAMIEHHSHHHAR